MLSNSNTTLVKVKFAHRSISHVSILYSNTTLVKVKYADAQEVNAQARNSNTTLVKVKCRRHIKHARNNCIQIQLLLKLNSYLLFLTHICL